MFDGPVELDAAAVLIAQAPPIFEWDKFGEKNKVGGWWCGGGGLFCFGVRSCRRGNDTNILCLSEDLVTISLVIFFAVRFWKRPSTAVMVGGFWTRILRRFFGPIHTMPPMTVFTTVCRGRWTTGRHCCTTSFWPRQMPGDSEKTLGDSVFPGIIRLYKETQDSRIGAT